MSKAALMFAAGFLGLMLSGVASAEPIKLQIKGAY
jgi:hypothetical protein